MAGKRPKRPFVIVDGQKFWNAARTAVKLNPPLNEQYLRKLARENQIPGRLEGKQWFFDLESVVNALNKRKSNPYTANVVLLDSVQKPKLSKKDLLRDPLADF